MRVKTMSAAMLVAGLIAVSFGGSSAQAQSTSSYPWCLMRGPGQSCYYTSMEQCMASRRGAVDFCEPNNTYTGNAASRSSRSRMPG
jgi:hypothetical protein